MMSSDMDVIAGSDSQQSQVQIKERPILLGKDAVIAVLDGSKTQTRRLVNPKAPVPDDVVQFERWIIRDKYGDDPQYRDSGVPLWLAFPEMGKEVCAYEYGCPFGEPGDHLWVRESAYIDLIGDISQYSREECLQNIYYRADGECCQQIPECACSDYDRKTPWRPSIHMPRWASRINLTVRNIRVERLQDISEEDALKEGIVALAEGGFCNYLRLAAS